MKKTLSLLLLLGCSLFEPNLFSTGVYRLDTNTVDGCSLYARIWEEEGRLLLRGLMTVSHHPAAEGPLSADAEITITGPDGKLLDRKNVPFRATRHRRRSHRPAFFVVVLDHPPPPGSLVTIRHRLLRYQPGSGLERIL